MTVVWFGALVSIVVNYVAGFPVACGVSIAAGIVAAIREQRVCGGSFEYPADDLDDADAESLREIAKRTRVVADQARSGAGRDCRHRLMSSCGIVARRLAGSSGPAPTALSSLSVTGTTT